MRWLTNYWTISESIIVAFNNKRDKICGTRASDRSDVFNNTICFWCFVIKHVSVSGDENVRPLTNLYDFCGNILFIFKLKKIKVHIISSII